MEEESPIKKRVVNDIGLDSDEDFGMPYRPANKENHNIRKPPKPEKRARNLNFDNNSEEDYNNAEHVV